MFLKIVACEISFREICLVAARSINLIDFEFLTQGYHNDPVTGRLKIQATIDAVPRGKYQAILLGYGLCNHILTGIKARHTPLVIPRAHDCITFFLGSKERYRDCFLSNSGTYYYTSGWLECRQRREKESPLQQSAGGVLQQTYEEMVEQYGEDNARYVMAYMGQWVQNYSQAILIQFDFTEQLDLRQQVETICQQNGWSYGEIPGSLELLQRWVDGDWKREDFLIVQPGEEVYPTYDDAIIDARAVDAGAPVID